MTFPKILVAFKKLIPYHKNSLVKKITAQIVKYTGIIAFGLWFLLSAVVIVALIDRWNHPNIKGISNVDLMNYEVFSFWLLLIFILSRILLGLLSGISKKKNYVQKKYT